jgi:hypothetical protein
MPWPCHILIRLNVIGANRHRRSIRKNAVPAAPHAPVLWNIPHKRIVPTPERAESEKKRIVQPGDADRESIDAAVVSMKYLYTRFDHRRCLIGMQ